MKKILICNGSIGGDEGNTQRVIDFASKKILEKNAAVEIVHLKELVEKKISMSDLTQKMANADGLIFTSGTYWDSWGSPMQYFLEAATELEASTIYMGKPAAAIITMHSVGGKGVLSRLQGVLNTLGFCIPPMSGLVYSLAGQLALESESSFADDFWSIEDIEVIIHNLLVNLHHDKNYRSWPVDHKDPKRIWIK